MTTPLTYHHNRPPVQPPYTPPRMSRAELEAATAGCLAAGPHTAEVIESITLKYAAIACIEARRDADGRLSDQDAADHMAHGAALPRLFRELGLYPASSAA